MVYNGGYSPSKGALTITYEHAFMQVWSPREQACGAREGEAGGGGEEEEGGGGEEIGGGEN